MPTFTQPPEWWISLANLTQWLYWPAWSAVLSFMALMSTIWLASRNNREARLRDSVVLMAASAHINALVGVQERLLSNVSGSSKEHTKNSVETSLKVLRKAQVIETLDQIDAAKFPTPETARTLLAARVAARHLVDILERFVSEEREDFQADLIASRIERLRASQIVLVREAKRRGYRRRRKTGRLKALRRAVRGWVAAKTHWFVSNATVDDVNDDAPR